MMEIVSNTKAVSELAELFHRNGYVRRPNLNRRALTPRSYKKGYEVRLVCEEVCHMWCSCRDGAAKGMSSGKHALKTRSIYATSSNPPYSEYVCLNDADTECYTMVVRTEETRGVVR